MIPGSLPLSFCLARCARGLLVALLIAAGPQTAAAASLSGAYLAGVQADIRDDYPVAAEYYRKALFLDPDNLEMTQNAAVAHVALGQIAEARVLSERLIADAAGSPIAILVLLAEALKSGDLDAAEALVGQAGEEANPLLTGLISGWIAAGRDDFTAAQAQFDTMTDNDAIAAFAQYHKALALALAGDFISAEAILAGGEQGPLHLSRGAIAAHAQILAQIDRTEEAVDLLTAAVETGYPDATLIDLRDRLAAGEEVPFDRVTTAMDGTAETFLMMAEGLNTTDSERLALIYARLAEYIRPDLVEAGLIAAEVLERQEQYAVAGEALRRVPPDSPWAPTAGIRRANIERAAGDPDAAIATLAALSEAHPDLIEVRSAHGDHLRVAERFAEAAAAYGDAIGLIETLQEQHWPLFYSRAISYERVDDWAAAEADFRKALELSPGQPLVQNYLGYSLVEQKRNLEEALAMIEQAVASQPDDGFITDSLGWVLYRLGRYEEALPHMLRAVELEPVDPIINDHLGDVLWKVNRRREAEFQWHRALSFGPADDLDMDRLRRKLEVGLDAVYAEEAKAN